MTSLFLTVIHFQSESDDSDIKIADFGFAKKVHKPNSLTTQCGTPGYVAPEILEGKPYDTQADMWSLGVIVYILLGGYPPFIEQNQKELFRKIRKGQYEFHEEYWGQVSKEAKDLISKLLTVAPDKRCRSGNSRQVDRCQRRCIGRKGSWKEFEGVQKV